MISEFQYILGMKAKLIRSGLLAGLAVLTLAILPAGTLHAAELVMFERDGCIWCLRWNREIGSTYERTEEGRHLPLRRVNVSQPSGIALAEPVRYTPTFVVSEGGREVGRITGYISEESFWGLLGKLIPAKPKPSL
jgi:thioredoxin-related protein